MISYTINFTSNTKTPFVIPPGEYNGPNHLLESPPKPNKASTSLNLPGAGTLRYGEMINEDLVRLLENFYNDTSPPLPTYGQTWVSSNDHIHAYTSNNKWTRVPMVNPEVAKAMEGDIQIVQRRAYMFIDGNYVELDTQNCQEKTEELQDWGFITESAPTVILDWGLTGEVAESSVDWGGICVEVEDDWGYTDEVLTETIDWGTSTDINVMPDFSVSWGTTSWQPGDNCLVSCSNG